jgi:hypothetical protein
MRCMTSPSSPLRFPDLPTTPEDQLKRFDPSVQRKTAMTIGLANAY